MSLLVVLISHILHIIDATSPVFRPVFFFNRMKKLHNCEKRHFQASLRQLKNSQIARNFARRTRTKVTVIWAKYNDEYSSFRTSCASNIAQLGVIIVFEKFWNFLVKPTSYEYKIKRSFSILFSVQLGVLTCNTITFCISYSNGKFEINNLGKAR